jgi:ABC-type glycerol-3-phosphate transport system permease component
MTRRQRRLVKSILIYTAAAVVLVAMLFPLYTLLLTSVQPEAVIRSRDVRFFPTSIILDHFREVLRPGHIVPIREAMLNSTALSLLTATVCLLFALPAAYALARLPVPGRRIVLGGLVSIYLLPTVLFLIPLFILFVNWRLDDSYFGLLLLYTGFILPFQVWVLRGFVGRIPHEVEEAARLDGCDYLQLFWHVVLPLIRPGIVAAYLFAFVLAWIEFLTPLIFTNGLKVSTVSLGLYRSTIDIQIGQLAAAAVLTLVPVVLLTLLFQRFITQIVFVGAER